MLSRLRQRLLSAIIGSDIWLAIRIHDLTGHRVGDCHALMTRWIDHQEQVFGNNGGGWI